MNHYAGKSIERRFAGPSLDSHIAEALKGEMRFKDLGTLTLTLALAFRGVANGLFCGAQILGVEIAFAVENLGMPQSDGGAGRAVRRNRTQPTMFCPMSRTLLPSGVLIYFDRLDFFDRAHRRSCGSHQLCFGRIEQGYALPVFVIVIVIIGGFAPSCTLQTGIVGLAVVNIRR